MNFIVILIAMLLILGIVPLIIIFRISIKDLRETRKNIKQNEKEIHDIIYGNKE